MEAGLKAATSTHGQWSLVSSAFPSMKRPAEEQVESLKPSKQRKTTNMDHAGLLSRWKSFGRDFAQLGRDTVSFFIRPSSDQEDVEPPPQTPTPSPSFPAPPPFSSRARRRNPPGSMGPPPTPPPRLTFPDESSSASSSSRPTTPSLVLVQSASDPVKRNYSNREHIHSSSHKKNVAETRKKDREEMQRKLFQLKRDQGFASDFKDFLSYVSYGASLQAANKRNILSPSPSLTNLHATPAIEYARDRRHSDSDASSSQSPNATPTHLLAQKETFLQKQIEIALKAFKGPKPPLPFTPSLEQLQRRSRSRDDAIEQRLRPKRVPLPSSLPPEDEAQVNALLRKRGVISKYSKEQVSDTDIARLRPSSWLNDEIINFYGALLLGRSETCAAGASSSDKENKSQSNGVVNGVGGGKKGKVLNVHYFSTFFWTKLEKDGYEKSRLAKWTKKIDIFSKDVILIPVNHNNMHWTGAAINFRRKRIESYDSMNMDRSSVYKRLRAYLDSEHRNKKKTPFDFTDWVDFVYEDTPQQENGYDCGVFTCQFLESISRGEGGGEQGFNFTQKDIPYLRRRMIWEIGNARLRDDS
ncbi:hypothetical protein D9758_002346 [Tetrapyrgos nigripes]|uniref:Ubiquitin-like protease family profile domain-containing protein n=1 Tax=Tetrapyrgos nigripes TaxID=182062 RepID=A0A8H5LSH8_9AGAR|nr:hypothetical protein D9758_002346 [Tetrapyrgos nigripes]